MTSHIISPRIPCNIIVSTFLQAHISPTHLSSELRSFVNQKYIQAQLQKRCQLDMKRESCVNWPSKSSLFERFQKLKM